MNFTEFNLAQPFANVLIAIGLVLAGAIISRLLFCKQPIVDRRKPEQPFAEDQEKFSTQRNVTYVLLGIFIGVCLAVFLGSDNNNESERSTVLQTVINLTLLAVGYWLGASKQSQDQAQTTAKLAQQVVTANVSPSTTKTETANVTADTVNVSERKD